MLVICLSHRVLNASGKRAEIYITEVYCKPGNDLAAHRQFTKFCHEQKRQQKSGLQLRSQAKHPLWMIFQVCSAGFWPSHGCRDEATTPESHPHIPPDSSTRCSSKPLLSRSQAMRLAFAESSGQRLLQASKPESVFDPVRMIVWSAAVS